MKQFIKRLKIVLVLCTGWYFSAGAQGLAVQNDTVYIGPLETAMVNVILNDVPTCSRYTLRVITKLNPATQGIAVFGGDYLVFMPSSSCRGVTVPIEYGLSCNNIEVTATVYVIVSQHNNPVNVIPPNSKCISVMPENVNFSPSLKYSTNPDNKLDGFSMPLVGDINGDGKPEIVALGLSRDGETGEGLGARTWYVQVFDGQTGALVWVINLGNSTGDTSPPMYLGKMTTLGLSDITDGNKNEFRLRSNPRHNAPCHLAIADLDRDGLAEIVVAETGSSGRIYALKPKVNAQRQITGFFPMWQGNNRGVAYSYKYPLSGNYQHFGAGMPYISDINGDGTPEVLIYNKIFDGRTGQIVCELETLTEFNHPTSKSSANTIRNNAAYVGRQALTPYADEFTPCMAIADIDGDGIMDIIAGSKVYKMKNDASGKPALDRIIYGPSSIAVQAGTNANSTETVYPTDGFTAVADIDLDGNLDVVVMNMVTLSGDNHRYILYVWDPLVNPSQPKAAMFIYEDGWEGYISYPFIGDINGRDDSYNKDKKLPEICFISGRLFTQGGKSSSIMAAHPQSTGWNEATHITLDSKGLINNSRFNNNSDYTNLAGFVFGLTYHATPYTPLHQRLKLSWVMEHVDRSQQTGITMFDFDNDGIMEICYKDEHSVRVISPSRQNYIPIGASSGGNSAIRFRQSYIYSYTGYEAPVIADVNMDGSADIVTMNYPLDDNPERLNKYHSYSYIHVWEHAPGTQKWAPAPPVWNQGIYYPLQINENLTVPAKPQSMLTSYLNKNGQTIYPYNGQWIQQPIVQEGKDYIPVVRLPDANVVGMKVRVVSTGSTEVKLTIRNNGDATLNANTPIAFYDGGTTGLSIENSAPITVLPIGVDIFKSERVTRTYTIRGDFNDKLIWARVSDNLYGFPVLGYDECRLDNNVASGADCPWLNYVITADDTVMCGSGGSVTLIATPSEAPRYTPTYQWYFNETLIPGANSQTYVTGVAGQYTCFVTENICRGFTPIKTIIRNNFIPPAVTLPTVQMEACEGSRVTLAGSYTDDGTFGNNLVARWEYSITGNTQNPAEWTIAPNSGSSVTNGIVHSTCVLDSMSIAKAGYYRLAVGSAGYINNYRCRATSDVITLQLLLTPSVSVSADNDSVCAGSRVTFKATPGSAIAPPASYTWNIAGASTTTTANTYAHVFNAAGAHTYSVSATNANGCSAVTAPQTIKVSVAPATPVIAPITNGCTGDDLFFNVTSPHEAYEWRADNSSGAVVGTMAYITEKADGTYTRVVRVFDNGCPSNYSAPVTGIIAASPASRAVSIKTISANYSAATPTVTFELSWAAGTRDCRHHSSVWVFVDYRPASGATAGSWTRAQVKGMPVTTGGSITKVAGNSTGFWLHGSAGTFSATITVPVAVSSPAFPWCAYATDYPPNATEHDGYYSLHGAVPFTVNGVTLGAHDKMYRGCITSLTDATGCPGILPVQPQAIALSADPASIAAGKSVTLRAEVIHGYSYSFDNGMTWDSAATKTVTPASSTTYTLRIKSRAGCEINGTVGVTVN
jgi:PKD repeat protein